MNCFYMIMKNLNINTAVDPTIVHLVCSKFKRINSS